MRLAMRQSRRQTNDYRRAANARTDFRGSSRLVARPPLHRYRPRCRGSDSMIPANRARKCSVHAIEFDATETSRCPACRERDKREALEQRVAALEARVGADQ